MNNAIFVSCKSIEEYKIKMKPILKLFAGDKNWLTTKMIYYNTKKEESTDYITAIYNSSLKDIDRLLKAKGVYYYINSENKIAGWDFGDVYYREKINVINLSILEKLE